MHRILSTAKIPFHLEPFGLYQSDGKRPDGVSVVPWKCGELLLWVATSPNTFAPSYSGIASTGAGMVAAQAEERKRIKYLHLAMNHIFTPVAIETSGVIGPGSKRFIHELGHRLEQVTGDANSLKYLLQRHYIAVQRWNSASILGSSGSTHFDADNSHS